MQFNGNQVKPAMHRYFYTYLLIHCYWIKTYLIQSRLCMLWEASCPEWDAEASCLRRVVSRGELSGSPKNSTEHPVLDLKENILENCSKKQISCILFLDLKKAFDSVSHPILLNKLEYYGVHGVALNLKKK